MQASATVGGIKNAHNNQLNFSRGLVHRSFLITSEARHGNENDTDYRERTRSLFRIVRKITFFFLNFEALAESTLFALK